jgi:hypothetical protein
MFPDVKARGVSETRLARVSRSSRDATTQALEIARRAVGTRAALDRIMRKTNPKPLKLDTSTIKDLSRGALERIAGGESGSSSYQGSVSPVCYLSGLTICATCNAL